MVLGGYPAVVAAGYAVGVLVEGLVTQQVLGGVWGVRHRLEDNLGIGRYTLAASMGACVGALLFALTSAVTGFGVVWAVGLAAFLTHLVSQLTLLAFFLEGPSHPGISGRTERNLRWALVLAVTLLAFSFAQLPILLFFILPLLGWTAMRATMREALIQLVVVAIISNVLVAFGRGPLMSLEVANSRLAELSVIPLQAFLLGCALVCLPFAMSVSRQRGSATEAANERERLRRIVESATTMAIIETDRRGRITLFNPWGRGHPRSHRGGGARAGGGHLPLPGGNRPACRLPRRPR